MTVSKKSPAPKKMQGSRDPEKDMPEKEVGQKVLGKTSALREKEANKMDGTDRMKELRKSLIKRREEIVKEAKDEIAKYMSGENRQLVDTAVDEGDWAMVDISEDLNLRRLDAHRKLMLDIDESLRKIREGTYGICEDCGEEISEKRLQVMPAATLCITCKENKEQLEAIERTENNL